MATLKFYIPAVNLMGAGCLQEAAADILKKKTKNEKFLRGK